MISRRALLIGTVAVVGVPVVATAASKIYCGIIFSTSNDRQALNLISSFFSNAAAVKSLGESYLNLTNSNAKSSLLRLQAQAQINRAIDLGCLAEMRIAVDRACTDDFLAGRVHCVEGWVLAETELNLAAALTVA